MLLSDKEPPAIWQKRRLTLLLLLTIALQLPFLNQAFHMDDGLFLHLAKNISKNIFFPQDLPIMFEGKWAQDLASMEHPPLTAYVLAAGAFLFRGFDEASLHGIFLIFPLMLTLSTYSLAIRFSQHPSIATALLMVLPSVSLMSHTLMADFPLLALWTASVATFVAGVDKNRKELIVLSSILVSCSILVSWAGICLIPLLVCYAWLSGRSSAGLCVIIIPLIAVGCWLCASYIHFHRFTPEFIFSYYFQTERIYRPLALLQKMGYVTAALGGITVFPLCLILPAVVRWRLRLVIGVISAFLFTGLTDVRAYALGPKFLFFAFSFVGSTVAAGFLMDTIRTIFQLRKIRQLSVRCFLGIWFCGVFFFCIVFYMTGSGRYLLPLIPPLVLTFVCEVEAFCPAHYRNIVFGGSIFATASLALLLSGADYQFSNIYRDFGKSVNSQMRINSRLWFTGEWGFRTYLENIGGEELGRRDARPQPGDWVAIPKLATPYTTLLSESVSFDSIIMVAPSRMQFAVPALNSGSTLVLAIGLPFWEKSDGLNFEVKFKSENRQQGLMSRRINPESGRTWVEENIPLSEIAGKPGLMIFEVSVGESGNATADWLAIAKARIDGPNVYDFRRELTTAKIVSMNGINYHTVSNRPVFPMDVTLAQVPALRMVSSREYRSSNPLRLLDTSTHAGFWSMGWGCLPFAFVRSGAHGIETLSIYEVIRRIDPYSSSQLAWYPE
jgi:hypothetical protein